MGSAILYAVKFDHDHLYECEYQNRFGVLERVYHPYMDEDPWASEVLIGDVPLQVGQKVTYLYDFGDRWEFGVTLERVDPDPAIDRPIVLDRAGPRPSTRGDDCTRTDREFIRGQTRILYDQYALDPAFSSSLSCNCPICPACLAVLKSPYTTNVPTFQLYPPRQNEAHHC